jgi:hypothetical protein
LIFSKYVLQYLDILQVAGLSHISSNTHLSGRFHLLFPYGFTWVLNST